MGTHLFKSLLDKNNLSFARQSILNGIEFTQMAAITHHQSAIFCGSQNHLTCDNHWSDGQLTILASQKILSQYPSLPSNYQLLWKSSLNKNNRLTFTPEGMAEQQGSFYLCKKNSNRCQTRIILLQTGRIRVEQTTLTQYVKNFNMHG